MRSITRNEGHNDQGYAPYEGTIALVLAIIAFLLFGLFALTFLTGLIGEMAH